jgi:hypothetical protein
MPFDFAVTKRVLLTQTPNWEEDAILENYVGGFLVERFRKLLGVDVFFQRLSQLFKRALGWPYESTYWLLSVFDMDTIMNSFVLQSWQLTSRQPKSGLCRVW